MTLRKKLRENFETAQGSFQRATEQLSFAIARRRIRDTRTDVISAISFARAERLRFEQHIRNWDDLLDATLVGGGRNSSPRALASSLNAHSRRVTENSSTPVTIGAPLAPPLPLHPTYNASSYYVITLDFFDPRLGLMILDARLGPMLAQRRDQAARTPAFAIGATSPGSEADANGVRIGDLLVSVDGEIATARSILQMSSTSDRATRPVSLSFIRQHGDEHACSTLRTPSILDEILVAEVLRQTRVRKEVADYREVFEAALAFEVRVSLPAGAKLGIQLGADASCRLKVCRLHPSSPLISRACITAISMIGASLGSTHPTICEGDFIARVGEAVEFLPQPASVPERGRIDLARFHDALETRRKEVLPITMVVVRLCV